MNDNLISQYIDNELSLDDKIIFVETARADLAFKEDAVSLLRQEQFIRSDFVDHIPAVRLKESTNSWYVRMFRPVTAATAPAPAPPQAPSPAPATGPGLKTAPTLEFQNNITSVLSKDEVTAGAEKR